MSTVISGPVMSLPRDIDVVVNISKPQAEATVDLSVPAFIGTDGFPDLFGTDASRVRYYSTLAAVAQDFAVSSEAYKAAVAFFSQSPRARTMAIARAFNEVQTGYLQCGALAEKSLDEWKSITDGAFGIAIDGEERSVTGLSFASITNATTDIADAVQEALRAFEPSPSGYTVAGAGLSAANGDYTPVSGAANAWSNGDYYLYDRVNMLGKHVWCIGSAENYQGNLDGAYYSESATDEVDLDGITGTWLYNFDSPAPTVTVLEGSGADPEELDVDVTYMDGALRIRTGSSGGAAGVSFMTSPVSGTDLSAILGGTEAAGAVVTEGYNPFNQDGTWNFVQELEYIRQAAYAAGRPIYGWVLEASLRSTDRQMELAQWVEAQTYGMAGLCTNSPNAYNSNVASDIGSLVKAASLHRTFVVYHNNSFYYPEMAIMAYALGVDYSQPDSTITTKFKVLQNIPTVPLTETQLTVLNSKRINTYTLVGVSSKTFREGVEADQAWFIDDLVNLDNFREDLQVAVYNVFLRNKKVPYNVKGATLLYAAMDRVCAQYVYNGTFTERPLTEAEREETGLEVEPAYSIEITPIESMSIADRARRVGPPAIIKVNLAGAIHSVVIGVEAYA